MLTVNPPMTELKGTDRRKASKRPCWIQDKNLDTVRRVRSRAPPLRFRYTVTRFRSNTGTDFQTNAHEEKTPP